ncbi:hypothetical protein [Streptomyces sp. 8ZJF_21]|uniref:hypothetical protein n=1 Tax=Streptomyces sp. 8ZJF_21 TaxID=2903141 RepID=UPI001E58AA73|nr:hypothetical protein [Streptomyces sp. 8ZJF_21]MCD9592417.1 hypothetical protein [Streptomyces sp. 8ZJF_21]
MSDAIPPHQPTGLEIALQWAQLPPEHLEIALKALDPELARQYELQLLREKLASQEIRDRRTHSLYLGGLIAGFVIVLAMLAGAVIVGVNGLPWLSAMLAGPSVLSLAGLFVLRRVDSNSAREVTRANRDALNLAQSPSPSGATVPGTGAAGSNIV